MEIRRSQRHIVSIEAEVISDGVSCTGFIGNLSEDGLFMRMPPSDAFGDFSSGLPVTLKLQLPSGDTVNLECRVKWVGKKHPGSSICNVGMEINKAPREYLDFLTGRVRC